MYKYMCERIVKPYSLAYYITIYYHTYYIILIYICYYIAIYCIYIILLAYIVCPDWKNTTIRRTAVRQTRVSRHHGSSIKNSPETPPKSQHCPMEALNWVPIIPGGVSLSEGQGTFLQSLSP